MCDFKAIPVIIPSLEPDERLPLLLGQMKQAGIENIVLVDDGSGPEYAPVFERAKREFGCVVLRHAVNLGKGRALKTAFNHFYEVDSLEHFIRDMRMVCSNILCKHSCLYALLFIPLNKCEINICNIRIPTVRRICASYTKYLIRYI